MIDAPPDPRMLPALASSKHELCCLNYAEASILPVPGMPHVTDTV